jgi:hypothetical protein
MLHLKNCVIDYGNICQLIASSPNLRSFLCSDLEQKDGCFDAITAHCPRLQVLSYGDRRPSVAALVRVLQSCPQIEVVNLRNEDYNEEEARERDEHIVAVMQHCARLKAFAAGHKCHNEPETFSPAALLAVATRAKDLRHLYLHGLDDYQDTEDAILSIAPHCGNFVSADFYGTSSLGYRAFEALASNLHSVKELRILTSDEVLQAIAANCPQLRVLHFCGACGDHTAQGLAEIVLGCPELKLVTYDDVDQPEVLTEFGEIMWKLLRPGIEFEHDDAECSLWDRLLDVERDELVIW